MGSCRLAHKGLCALRSLALTGQSAEALVIAYLQRSRPSQYLRDQLNVECWPYIPAPIPIEFHDLIAIAPIEGRPEVGPDVITDTVLDDCPECFNWLCGKIPRLNASACNEHGWSFIGIACYAGSSKILEQFFDVDDSRKSPIGLLAEAANHNTLEPTPIGLVARQRSLQSFDQLFSFIQNNLHALKVSSLLRGALTDDEKMDICTFATPELAQRLERIGVEIFDISSPRSSSWHAGARNGPGMLDYLNSRSTQISKNGPMWILNTPLHAAVQANRLESVRWLKHHGASAKLTYGGDTRQNPIHLAALQDSEMSVEMLEVLLPAPGRSARMSSVESGKILYSLVEGLVCTVHSQAVRTDLDENAYLQLRDVYEHRAIRKCRLILKVSAGDHLAPVSDPSRPRLLESGRHLAVRQHERGRMLAWLSGFDRLLDTMDQGSEYVHSPDASFASLQIR